MLSQFRLIGLSLTALLGAASAANAGGNSVAITEVRGTVELKSLQPGGHWSRAKPGLIAGTYLMRTGPRSWARLEERGGWMPHNFNRGCVDANTLIRVESSCGFRIQVLRGQISAVDGKRGKSMFKTVGG
jgi:hypothetical protein